MGRRPSEDSGSRETRGPKKEYKYALVDLVNGKYELSCLHCGLAKDIAVDKRDGGIITCKCGQWAPLEMVDRHFRLTKPNKKDHHIKAQWIVSEIEDGIPIDDTPFIDDDLIRKMRLMKIGQSIRVTGGQDVSVRPAVAFRSKIISKQTGEQWSFTAHKVAKDDQVFWRIHRIDPAERQKIRTRSRS